MNETTPPSEDSDPLGPTESFAPVEAAAKGARIGAYRIRGLLGTGGMGDVYLADQDEPVRRSVALKVIRLGMDTAGVVSRFESERQALARLNHPNIAQIYEAGSTDRGRPYFAMEFIPGWPLTKFADERRLSIPDRVKLFLGVCAGVQHAHQKGLIHRDLKPSNIVVTEASGRAEPKIIDFGIAKATHDMPRPGDTLTEAGQLIGTPGYMSPEQARPDAIGLDTRSDIYALGLVLYEFLTGSRALDPSVLQREGVEAYLRQVRELEPVRPSSIVLPGRTGTHDSKQDAALKRGAPSPHALARQLRGELDWIVARALEKDPARRYQTVAELADDLRRHLANEPVLAGPPGAGYRVQKFVQKHRAGVAAAGFVLLTLVLGLAGTTIGFLQARRAERAAKEEALTTRHVTSFMIDLFRVSDPGTARGNTITAREVLDEGSRRIQRGLAGQPIVRARMMEAMGEVYRNLGLLDQAQPLLEESYRERQQRLPADHRDLASSIQSLGHLRLNQGRFEEAKSLFLRARDMRTHVLPAGDVDIGWSEYWLATAESFTGHMDDALPRLLRAEEIFRDALGYESQPVAWCVNDIGMIRLSHGDCMAAATRFEEAARIKARILGPDHPDVAISLGSAGYAYTKLKNLDRALPMLETALAISEKSLGPRNAQTASVLQSRGEALRIRGDFGAARDDLTRALSIQDSAFPPSHPEVILTRRSLASLAMDCSDPATAVAHLDRAIVALATKEGGRGVPLAECLEERARGLEALGRAKDSERSRADAAAVRRETPGSAAAIGYIP